MYLLSLGHAVGRETATQTLSRWVSCKGAVQQLFSIYIYIEMTGLAQMALKARYVEERKTRVVQT